MIEDPHTGDGAAKNNLNSMKKLFSLLVLICAVALSCCKKFDDSDLWRSIGDIDKRLAAVEEQCRLMNTNIVSLQAAVAALQKNDCVTGVTPIVKEGKEVGYTITFAKSQPITIYHGQDGQDGNEGAKPIIGVKQEADGIYYWTLDGQWLTDSAGNKIKTEGVDGEQGDTGITPQLKIEEGYWHISYDNGATWTQLGKAVGEKGEKGERGDAMFRSITQDDDTVTFTLADGSEIVIPKYKGLTITFDRQYYIPIKLNETQTIKYTIAGGGERPIIKVIVPENWTVVINKTDAASGEIAITCPANRASANEEAMVLVSDGKNTTAMRNLTFMVGDISFMYYTTIDGKPVETPNIEATKIGCNIYEKDENGEMRGILALYSAKIPEHAFGNTLKTVTTVGNFSILARAFAEQPYLTTFRAENISYMFTIEQSAFNKCPALESVFINGDGKSEIINIIVGDYAFSDNKALTEFKITGCEGVAYIRLYTEAFAYCSNLKSVIFPNSVSENSFKMSDRVFLDCTSLENITFPEGTCSISDHEVFDGCSALRTITFPSTTYCFNFWFRGCKNLSAIYIKATDEWATSSIGFNLLQDHADDLKIYVPTEKLDEYKQATGFSNVKDRIFGYDFK